MQGFRVAHYQALIDWELYLILEIGIFLHRHLIDKRLMKHIFVSFLGRSNSLALIGENLHAGCFCLIVQQWHHCGVKLLIIYDGTCGAINHTSAIICQNVTAKFLQAQLRGKWHNAIGGTSGRKHHFHPCFLSLHQGTICAGRHFFLLICECAVEIEHNHSVFYHIYLCVIFFFYGFGHYNSKICEKSASALKPQRFLNF